jgi:Skp family chaperone for outer membrane proteins
MQPNTVLCAAMVLGFAAVATRTQTVSAPAPLAAKIAVLDMQGVLVSTKEGSQAIAAMQAGLEKKKAQLQKEQTAIETLEDKLRKGATTLSDEERARLSDEIQKRKRNLTRDADDLNTEAEQESSKLNQDLTAKMVAVIDKYAAQKGYTLVLDGNPPVVWAAQATNISTEIVQQYDQARPAAAKPDAKK